MDVSELLDERDRLQSMIASFIDMKLVEFKRRTGYEIAEVSVISPERDGHLKCIVRCSIEIDRRKGIRIP